MKDKSKLNISISKDYSMFKTLGGNREVSKLHLARLKKSMQDNHLISPILVNENMQIIDGQHRFTAAKELNLPIYYFIVNGYGLKEVQTLNANSKNWNADDYLTGYVDMGKPAYIEYKQFLNKYKLGHQATRTLLYGYADGSVTKMFFNGDFIVKDKERAVKIADYLVSLKPFYAGYKRRSFVSTIIALLDNPNFDPAHFYTQAEKNISMFYDCPSMAAYKEMIENIYNYRKHSKVNLRF